MTPERPAPAASARSLLIAAVTPVIVLAVLFGSDIPLGCPGRFVYRYSPIVVQRLASVPAAVLVALALAAGLWALASPRAARRRTGAFIVVVASVALASWTCFAPPAYLNQHVFNMQSPSQDGAFVREALRIDSVRAYLRSFPQRALTPPAEMRGTRVISNPPGTTLLAVGIKHLLIRSPALRAFVARPLQAQLPPGDIVPDELVLGLAVLWSLAALWLASGLFFYLTARLFLPTDTAAAVAVCTLFSPMTLLFSPGKDTAQLLLVAPFLYLALRALRRTEVPSAALAGAAFVVTSLASLVALWIAAVLLVTALWNTRDRDALKHLASRILLPGLLAAALTALGLYALTGLNWLHMVQCVAQAQAGVTRGPDAMPIRWQLLGIPLFLLLSGPAILLSLGTLSSAVRHPPAADPDARFGRRLLLATLAALLATIAFTNLETPRLWIPFTPLILLGGALQPAFWQRSGARAGIALALLVLLQIGTAAVQWSVLDARESEYRLAEARFFE